MSRILFLTAGLLCRTIKIVDMKNIPAVSGVYVLYGEAGECLYVGSSIDMRARMGCHRYRKQAFRAEYHPCEEGELVKKEKELTGRLKPKLARAASVYRTGRKVFPMERMSFAFTEEDIAVLEKIKSQMASSQGRVSNIAAIRLAIRAAAGRWA